jgi:hypothetical protein
MDTLCIESTHTPSMKLKIYAMRREEAREAPRAIGLGHFNLL